MSRRRTAAAVALLLAALAAAGCGVGPGDRVGEVSLTVTRDYGAETLAGPTADSVRESDTVMRVLDRNMAITTRYGGGFVQSIDGLEGGERGGRAFDWLFYVNGVEATVGAAEYPLRGGEEIWWDFRDWSVTTGVGAVVGSWPQPFTGGYDGRRRPVSLACLGAPPACSVVRERLEGAGARIATGHPPAAIRVLVGPWARVRHDPAAARLEQGPQESGVFADFATRPGGFALRGLDEAGDVGRVFGPQAGLVAATRRFGAAPVWVVTGAARQGALAAAGLLRPATLRHRYAVATDAGKVTALPLR